MSDTITAAMVAQHLLTQVSPDTPVVLIDDDFDGEGDYVALDVVLKNIANEYDCHECGEPMTVTSSGISHHLHVDGGIDHDADADHVALLPMDAR